MVLRVERGGAQERSRQQRRKKKKKKKKRRRQQLLMCCYVGKATKIFLCLVAALLVAGLVLGLGLARHTWGANRAQPDCRWPDCQQQQGLAYGGDPLLPATAGAATTPTNPLTQPAVAAFPGATATPSSSSAGAAAPPTGVPYFGPPGPFVVGLGPAAHA